MSRSTVNFQQLDPPPKCSIFISAEKGIYSIRLLQTEKKKAGFWQSTDDASLQSIRLRDLSFTSHWRAAYSGPWIWIWMGIRQEEKSFWSL